MLSSLKSAYIAIVLLQRSTCTTVRVPLKDALFAACVSIRRRIIIRDCIEQKKNEIDADDDDI